MCPRHPRRGWRQWIWPTKEREQGYNTLPLCCPWRVTFNIRHICVVDIWIVHANTTIPEDGNKAAISLDRRLRPRRCQLGSYFKRPKCSPVRPLACNWYYCAQFIAKPKAVCALFFSWAATSSHRGLWANMTSSIKPEVHDVSLYIRRQRRTEPRP